MRTFSDFLRINGCYFVGFTILSAATIKPEAHYFKNVVTYLLSNTESLSRRKQSSNTISTESVVSIGV
jgi:hypothetical protein